MSNEPTIDEAAIAEVQAWQKHGSQLRERLMAARAKAMELVAKYDRALASLPPPPAPSPAPGGSNSVESMPTTTLFMTILRSAPGGITSPQMIRMVKKLRPKLPASAVYTFMSRETKKGLLRAIDAQEGPRKYVLNSTRPLAGVTAPGAGVIATVSANSKEGPG